MTAPPLDPDLWYEARVEGGTARVARLEGALLRWSRLRIGAFVVTVAPLLLLETTGRSLWPPLLGAAGLGFSAFLVFILKHRQARRARDEAALEVTLAREGLARRTRAWDALPLPPLPPPPPNHPWSLDLDALGRGSLAHLLGTPRTGPGLTALSEALLSPFTLGAEGRARRRREVDALARRPEWLLEVQACARGVRAPTVRASASRAPAVRAPGGADPLEPFLRWAEGEGGMGSLGSGAAARWRLAQGALLVLNVGLLALQLGWGAPPFWLGSMAVGLLLSRRLSSVALPAFAAVDAGGGSLGRWSALLRLDAERRGDLERGEQSEEGDMSAPGGPAPHEALAQLERISEWAAIRHQALVYAPLAAFALWDLFPLLALERWRSRHGTEARRWLQQVGELELLTALGLLRFEHPAWTFPVECEGGRWEAQGLAHPLLPLGVAVANDVSLPPPGELLLVTGSNMSGKSTLLRAIGTNHLLLLMGAPVAASHLEATPLTLWTSMRIRDSLTDGISHFMAELHRLRDVVEGARAAPALVLLDEILQGTNSAERRTAASILLQHLMTAGAVGAVSTHDLTLAADPALTPHLAQVHLRETVTEQRGTPPLLRFDHKLRPGPATSRNALLLLESMGLGPAGGSG
jgi:hypothetical protein